MDVPQKNVRLSSFVGSTTFYRKTMTVTKAQLRANPQGFPSDDLSDEDIYYPDSDGEPVANNTLHYELIATTKAGLERLFANRDDVFVAADLFWYPVKGNPKIAVAPDVMVAFSRPPGARKSYKQWEENDTPFHVVFEFLSEANTQREMFKKAMFFDRYGAEEYYVYDMERGTLDGYIRYGGELSPIEDGLQGWVSPRLGIRFEVEWSGRKPGRGKPTLIIYNPDGTRFLSYQELASQLDEAQAQLQETTSQLQETTSQLQETTSQLTETASKLQDTTSKLSEAEMKLQQEQEQNRILLEKLRALGGIES